ncbi:MAG: phosphatase PAP2 family protein [Firmicutes bacterium]|jgi:membrane-associated phospholipid phosphatase|nr:phosphatase PAP2 family protein [Bacillota bacterium]HPU01181.1 phosphatase PAP2 family protein [Bacillota bacterium]
MSSPPVSRPYFSSRRGWELFWLLFCWAVVLACCALLYFYWDWSRSMSMINWLQQFRAIKAVEYFFQFFTFLGNDEFYMIFFGILIWCVDKPLGFWSAAVLLVSGLVSGAAKDLFALERPPRADQLESFAFPSGHTFTAVTVWGYMAMRLKRRWFWYWTIAAMIFIPLSRIVLVYHYPGDILGGYAMGIPLLLLIAWLSSLFVERGWDRRFSKALLLALCVGLPVILTVISPQGDMPKLMGLLAGASAGYMVEKEKVRSVTRTHWALQLLKAVLGLAVLFGILMGLAPLLSSDNPALQAALRFFRYALGGIWVTLLAPALFVVLKLTPREAGD